ncbi:MAG: NADH/ubiquinone/plastoquinone (complex I) [Candidatus Omnitrophica bacterium]|nr:NADH/ubiquinone/plastoquinone (complex I) [Candidatus Omnitrophota bacterium]
MMNAIILFVALPLFAAFLLPIMGKFFKRGFDTFIFLVVLFLIFLSLYMLIKPPAMPYVYKMGGWPLPFGITWLLDSLSVFMLFVVNLITFFAAVYSIDYMKQYTCKWKYYCLLMLLLAGLNGVALSADLFNVFIFLEITSIASYALVAYGTGREETEASFKYMVLGSVASAFILLGIAVIYAKTSTLNMFDMARAMPQGADSLKLKLFIATLFITGFGLKAALVPFHSWLPDAHPSAPAPISAMLSGVVIKVIGVYALIRIMFNIFSLNPVISELLLALGGLSMFVGVVLAIGQWDFKRLLAYHSISQIGYVVCGIALGTPLGIAGGLFHLLNHSVFKSLLFLNAGSVEYACGTRELKKLGNLKEDMPHTSWTSMVASLSIAGVPPLCGFWSKFIIIVALFQANRFFYGSLAILVGLITLGSFLKVQRYIFYRKLSGSLLKVKEAPVFMCLSMAGLAILCVLIGIFFKPILDNVLIPASQSLLGGREYFITLLGI